MIIDYGRLCNGETIKSVNAAAVASLTENAIKTLTHAAGDLST